MFPPLMVCLLCRGLNTYDYSKGSPRSTNLDTIIRFLLIPSVIYYTVDSFFLLYNQEVFGWCNFAFFLHHIITLAGYKASVTMAHFPWFFLAAFPCHCLLIMFPYHTELNYLYLVVILNCLYSFTIHPWKINEKCQWIFKTAWGLLLGPIFLLWWYECKNDMKNLDI